MTKFTHPNYGQNDEPKNKSLENDMTHRNNLLDFYKIT